MTVLVVDDDVDVRTAMAASFNGLGLATVQAADAEEALHRLRRDASIDVLLTDITMPGMDGLQLLRLALAERDDAHALEGIVMSGAGTTPNAIEAMRRGAIDFLVKPFSLRQAMDAARRAQDRAQARRDRAAAEQNQRRALDAAKAELTAMVEKMLAASGADGGDAANPIDRLRILAHELRTPLVPVLGLSEILRDDPVEPAEVAEYGREIAAGAERLLASINRLLAYEQLAAQTDKPVAQPIDAAALARQMLDAAATEAGAIKTALVPDVEPGLSLVGDAALLTAALGELLANAITASPAGGLVTLRLARHEGGVCLSVSDQGPGVPDAILDRPGVAFVQGETPLTRRRPGLGLGLAIARRIAELHQGELRLCLRPEGGTEAALFLPAG